MDSRADGFADGFHADSLEERRRAQREEKERVKSRLATMEPLLQNTYVRQPPSPASAAIGNFAAERAARERSIVAVPPPPPPGETTPLIQNCAEWPPIVGQTVEVYSRRLRVWVPAEITRVDGDEATVTYKEGSRRGTKSVAIDDPRVMRWSLQAWLERYHLGAYTKALAAEGYDGHPGYMCAVGDQELEDLVRAVEMKRPQAKVFRQAVLDLSEPRPDQTPFTLTTNLLVDKSSGSSSESGSEGQNYNSALRTASYKAGNYEPGDNLLAGSKSGSEGYDKPAEVGLVGGTQKAASEDGGSGKMMICVILILALAGVGGCQF